MVWEARNTEGEWVGWMTYRLRVWEGVSEGGR